jgi:hypothetical protein
MSVAISRTSSIDESSKRLARFARSPAPLNFPASQSTQTSEAAEEYFPAEQFWQAPDASPDLFPASQSVQIADAADANFPDEHGVQIPAPAAE